MRVRCQTESNRGGRTRSRHGARRESYASLLNAREEIECYCILALVELLGQEDLEGVRYAPCLLHPTPVPPVLK